VVPPRAGSDPLGNGPIRTLTDAESFAEIHLLHDKRTAACARDFKFWLGSDVTLHPSNVTKPTSYTEVYRVDPRG
jgi:hypothetical protein